MSKELGLCVLGLSQLNRGLESRPNKRPNLGDLRESGGLEQDADVVMFLHRDDVYVSEEEWVQQNPGQPYTKNVADLIVAKHRNGPTGNLQLFFRDNYVRFDSFARVDSF